MMIQICNNVFVNVFYIAVYTHFKLITFFYLTFITQNVVDYSTFPANIDILCIFHTCYDI